MSRARRIDANQHAIVKGLRRAGVWVCITSGVGDGFPDAVTWHGGRFRLLEIKRPGGSFTDRQLRFMRSCPGEVQRVESLEEALRAHGIETARKEA